MYPTDTSNRVEEVYSDDSAVSDGETPDDTTANNAANNANDSPSAAENDALNASRSKQSRSEKRARKILSKLGLKPVTGIFKISIKNKKSNFAIFKPEMYHVPGTDTYIIYGEAKIEDPASHVEAAKRFMMPNFNSHPEEIDEDEGKDDEVLDETGLNQQDIQTLQDQTNCSRSKAIKVLRQTPDIVEALMKMYD